MFIGRHDHTIDPKGRVSIPSEYRTGLQRDSDDPPVLARLPGGCLALYPWQAWLENEGRIARMQAFRPELYSLQRFLLEGVARCPVDRQGRVLVPPRLREWAGLQREAVVLGAGPRVELWEPGRLEQDLVKTGMNYGEYSELAGLGIRENPAGGAGGESPSG